MKRTLLWALVCAAFVLLAVTGSAAQAGPNMQTEVGPTPPLETLSVAQLEERGDTLRAQRAYADALACYRAALRKDKNNASLYNKAGIAELQLKDMKGAQKDFKRAIKHDSKLSAACNNLGVVLYMRKSYAEAVAQYQKAIALDAMNASYHSNLGTALFSQNQVEKAVTEFARAIELDPEILMRPARGAGASAQLATPEERAHYFFVLAKMYGARGELDRCLQCLEKAKEGNYPHINDVYKDKDFEAVRQNPRLQEIMAKPVN
ncbi:MAG TPA: tetratricopeptide repeat protein [Terriglobales bacterium]|nr:tetratricopeptide repeat protein [Terriglobales bacterium]